MRGTPRKRAVHPTLLAQRKPGDVVHYVKATALDVVCEIGADWGLKHLVDARAVPYGATCLFCMERAL